MDFLASAQLQALAGQGRWNHVINGGFSIAARGASQTSSGCDSIDRWSAEHNGSTKTASRQAFTVGQTDVPSNPKYYGRQVVSSVAGAGNFSIWRYRIEDVTELAGKIVTLSFWAKADAPKNIATEFRQFFGSGGSATNAEQSVTTHALTTSWQRFTVTGTLLGILGETIGTGSATEILFWLEAGSTYDASTNSLGQQSGTFDIANVALYEGAADSEFVPRPESLEEALCERYYEQSTVKGIHPSAGTATNSIYIYTPTSGTTPGGTGFRFRTRKRADPVTTLYSINSGISGRVYDATAASDTTATSVLSTSDEGGVTLLVFTTPNAIAGHVYAFHYTAEAELYS